MLLEEIFLVADYSSEIEPNSSDVILNSGRFIYGIEILIEIEIEILDL